MTTRTPDTELQERPSSPDVGQPSGSAAHRLLTTSPVKPHASDAIRSMPDQFRALFHRISADGSGVDRTTRRPDPSAVEHLLCLRDTIGSTAQRLERLANDARPVRQHAHRYEHVAGYQRWDPNELQRTLSSEAERLARIAEQLWSDEGLPGEVRLGLEAIAGEQLRHVLRCASEELGDAELALRP